MIELWVVLAIGAGLAQTTRNALAQSISREISPALNSWARFAFCLPFAATVCAVVVGRGGVPILPASFFFFCLATATFQLIGNVALVSAFRAGGFGESIVFHKLEVILTAVVGALLFAELPSREAVVGIVLSGIGVIVVNLTRDGGKKRVSQIFALGRSGRLSLLCAVLLVGASFALKAANTIVSENNPAIGFGGFAAPVQTLFHTTWMEVVLLSAWILKREPRAFRGVQVHWRRMFLIGSAGFVASLGWFWAYSLTLVAYVKAIGQIEAVIAVVLAIRVLQEKTLIRQIPGILLVMIGITFVLLS